MLIAFAALPALHLQHLKTLAMSMLEAMNYG